MAFKTGNIHVDKKEEPSQAPLSSSNLDLTKEEIEIILLMIKEASFKGEHVERVYGLVYKLQQYYLSLNR